MLFGKRGDKQAKSQKKGSAQRPGFSHINQDSPSSSAIDSGAVDRLRAMAVFPVDVPSEESAALLVAVSSVDQLERSRGNSASGTIEDGWLRLAAGDGGQSLQAFPATEGELFVAKAKVALLEQGMNHVASSFYFGPVFLNEEGKVLLWWKSFDKPGTEPCDISVEARAPAGAFEVKLGLHGSWDRNGNAGDYVVGFADARLIRILT